ncbi:MAG: hypothetical protein LC135_04220 [Phycisphaerae bacterium]|jgi:flagellar basal body-associated protein FliL|nr:hypothetical protein [Phycisphaerae bacterium]MCZ2399058.1 hypothetical protein [Phycisphaerae bacterium]NUQ49099.1 hypothetical protein [Phycisphaerae bacterium]
MSKRFCRHGKVNAGLLVLLGILVVAVAGYWIWSYSSSSAEVSSRAKELQGIQPPSNIDDPNKGIMGG